ncbi:MAG TPA: homoserine dehydrogenase [Candidatus Limnocylindrales bacterium]|nr:homoserine dehydrogenase [Candidatus Limnocylindrales bacterium]
MPTATARPAAKPGPLTPETPLRVAVLGAGTVGREVVRAFLEDPERLAAQGGRGLVLAGVAVRDLDRAIARRVVRHEDLLTDAPAHLVALPDVDVVVELMGGEEPARTLIAAALTGGKAVVTANKHVVAHHGPALEAISRQTGAPLRFEAAVGGGIPVLGPLATDLAANRVDRVRAIVNGTTNHILTAMARDGRAYADVLADAQAAGYAEADPTADVEALDAANKLAILARAAFGSWLDPDAIERRPPTTDGAGKRGITGVLDVDVAAAAALGLVIKLLAEVSLDHASGRLRAAVLPTAVGRDEPLGRTDGVMNRVEVRATPVGSVAFEGPGAGGSATASAVLGDLLAVARGAGSTLAGRPPVDRSIVPLPPVEGGRHRGWFFVLPPTARLEALAKVSLDGVDCAAVRGGTAVHVRSGDLVDVRGAVREALPGAADLTIYPAAEHDR